MARILIIDDEAMNRLFLRDILEPKGHEIVEAQDGMDGIRHYREEVVDLVITDIVMPNQDGLEMIQRLTGEFPDAKIIAYTSYDSDSEKGWLDLAKEWGAQVTLEAPLDRIEVMEAVEEVLG